MEIRMLTRVKNVTVTVGHYHDKNKTDSRSYDSHLQSQNFEYFGREQSVVVPELSVAPHDQQMEFVPFFLFPS